MGFEPTQDLRPGLISSQVPSTAQPPFQTARESFAGTDSRVCLQHPIASVLYAYCRFHYDSNPASRGQPLRFCPKNKRQRVWKLVIDAGQSSPFFCKKPERSLPQPGTGLSSLYASISVAVLTTRSNAVKEKGPAEWSGPLFHPWLASLCSGRVRCK